jgi:LemA protein
MNAKNLGIIAIILGLLLFGGCACSRYNGMVGQDETVKKAWNDVQSDYQNRADLIPNLVNTVKGAADFEKTTLTQLMEARAKATSVNINADNLTPEKIAEFQQAQAAVSSGIGRLLAVVENYPDLKANANFQKLQTQLEEIENRIRNSRNQFNTAVQGYNMTVRQFPNNIFAGIFGFKMKEGFQADAGAERAPEVKF